jgi:hypothetical protein
MPGSDNGLASPRRGVAGRLAHRLHCQQFHTGAARGKLRYDPISLTAPADPRHRAWRCYGNTAACSASAISDET